MSPVFQWYGELPEEIQPSLIQLSEPLRRLCKSEVKWAWESEQQSAFEAIKQVITTLPVLAYFDKTKKHTIQCNASKKGPGAVLLQSPSLSSTCQEH